MSIDYQPKIDAYQIANDGLIAGGVLSFVTESITLTAGNLQRGALLGKIAASGKFALSTASATDGSQIPSAVLAIDTDASSGDAVTVAYLTGVFNTSAMNIGAGHTPASLKPVLRRKSIFMWPNVPAGAAPGFPILIGGSAISIGGYPIIFS